MNVLVTGGAGYIGSIVTEELLKSGHRTIVLDNLQQGHKQAVPAEAEFVLGDICDLQALENVFERLKIDAIIHLAAESTVERSTADPRRCFQTNVIGGLNLLNTMVKHGLSKIIFSSSAAVYGQPKEVPIKEDHPTLPTNPYGESKLIFERMLKWYAEAHGLRYISLRYFNAAGASKRLGEDHRPETHLIPKVLRVALNKQGKVPIFGNDYPTPDGSCIRDYVHVLDIARAHILALEKLESLGAGVYNLGSEVGYSVIEVIEMASRITRHKVPVEVCPRRPGDPAILVANSDLARLDLGWKPVTNGLEDIIESAWNWLNKNPNGYKR